jgi:hypothetical protein
LSHTASALYNYHCCNLCNPNDSGCPGLPQAELHRRHQPVIAAVVPLIERGQRAGKFRSDVPAAWHLSMLLALIHAASAEVDAGRVPAAEIEPAVGSGRARGGQRAAGLGRRPEARRNNTPIAIPAARAPSTTAATGKLASVGRALGDQVEDVEYGSRLFVRSARRGARNGAERQRTGPRPKSSER